MPRVTVTKIAWFAGPLLAVAFAAVLAAAPVSAGACPTSGDGVTCFGGESYCSVTRQCYTEPTSCPGNQVLNCAACGCRCPGGTTWCAARTLCTVNQTCPAGLTWDPCTETCTTPYVLLAPSATQTGGTNVSSDIKMGGDLFMTTDKAVRVDGAGQTVLNIGNWGSGATGVDATIWGKLGVGASPIGTARLTVVDGIYSSVSAPGAIGLFAINSSGTGYGVRAENQADGGTALLVNNNTNTGYGVYQAGTAATNFMQGKLGLNVDSPAEQLEVAGRVKATGYCIGASCIGAWPGSGGLSGSGTADYLPKFTAASTLGNSQIQDNGTGVGIGAVPSATSKLAVNGGVEASVSAPGAVGVFSTTTSSSGVGLRADSEANGGTALFLNNNAYTGYGIEQVGVNAVNYFEGKAGFGTTTPAERVDVVGNVKARGLYAAGTYADWSVDSTWSTGSTIVSKNQTRALAITSKNAGGSDIGSMVIGNNDTAGPLVHIARGLGSGLSLQVMGTAYVFGNVGIGTATPSYKLHVAGTIYSDSQITSPNIQSTGLMGSTGTITSGNNFTAVNGVYAGGDGSFGGDVSGANFSASGTVLSDFFNFYSDTNTGIYRAAADTLAVSTGGSERLRVNASGNVGIGAEPSARLHVLANSSVSTTPIAIIESSGTQMPIEFRYGGAPVGRVRANSGGAIVLAGMGGDVHLRAGDDSATDLLIDSATGNVGVGDTAPATFKIEVAGSVGPSATNSYNLGNATYRWGCLYYNNSTLGTCASDARLKQDVSDLDFGDALSQIAGLRLRRFSYKSDAERSSYDGLIAQEVEGVSPALVETGADGYKYVRYGDLQWMTLQALQQLNSLAVKLDADGKATVAALAVEGDVAAPGNEWGGGSGWITCPTEGECACPEGAYVTRTRNRGAEVYCNKL